MELLVVTLAYTNTDRDADILARIRLIVDTVRNAPGLVISQAYRSQGTHAYYLLLTTWDTEESWYQAQDRYNPKHLLLSSTTELLTALPEQWLMHYLWGYSRPAAIPTLAGAHLAHIGTGQVEAIQQHWIEELRQQAVHPTLAFAFLARGIQEDRPANNPQFAFSGHKNTGITSTQQASTFLNLLCWSNEAERDEFFANPHYQALHQFVGSKGVVQILPLEPM
jgi:quinol monooxygenase YgiN